MFKLIDSQEAVTKALTSAFSPVSSYGHVLHFALFSGPVPTDLDAELPDTIYSAYGVVQSALFYNYLENSGRKLVANTYWTTNQYFPIEDGKAFTMLNLNQRLTLRKPWLVPTWFILHNSSHATYNRNGHTIYKIGMYGTVGLPGSGADLELNQLDPLPRNLVLPKVQFSV